MFCIKYMHKIRQKRNDFRFLMVTFRQEHLRPCTYISADLFSHFSESFLFTIFVKFDQMLYIIYIYFSCSFYREAYQKLCRGREKRKNHSGNKADILSHV